MNLSMIQPGNEQEDLLLSITKNCRSPIKQTHAKPQETLEFKMTEPREAFHFNPSVRVEEDLILGLMNLEVYDSIFNITEENTKFEFYKIPEEKSGGVLYEKVRDEIEKDLDISDSIAADLQDEVIDPIIIKEYREQVTRRMKDDKFMLFLPMYIDSVLQDFEGFLRIQVELVEDDFRLVLDGYNSSFITYELELGIYTFQYISKALFDILQPEYELYNNSIDVEYDDITMKTKLVVRPGIIATRFDEKTFFL